MARPVISRTQTAAAVFAAFPAALALAMAMAIYLPFDPSQRAIASGLLLPLFWVGFVLWAVLARSGRAAWVGLGSVTFVAAGLVGLRMTGGF